LVEGAGKPTAGSIVASTLLTNVGQEPIAFELTYSNANIDPNTTYTVVAAIQDGDRKWSTPAGTPVITKGAPTSGLDLVLVYRADLAKGAVTGAISGVDINLSATAFSATVVLDLASDTSIGFDVNLEPIGVPIAFKVPFDPADIDQDRSYVVTAGIFDASSRWVNDTGVPVITKGNPLSGVTVPVAPPGAAVASGDNGLGLLGTILGIVGIAALIVAAVVFIRSRRPPALADGPGAGPDGGPGPDAGPSPGGGPGPEGPGPGPDAGPTDPSGPAAADRPGPEPGGPLGPG
jgi:uncharacterized lipoprotein YbaY